MDWQTIKAEYVAGGTSYRKLAAKYDVPFSTLKRVAAKEKWCELRERAKAKADTKIINAVSDAAAKKESKVIKAADKLLDKLIETIDTLPAIDSQSLKHFTSALKDLRDIKGVKSDADMREQEARIANLQKQAEKDKPLDDRAYGVVLMPCVAEALTPPEEDEDE